MNKGVGIVVQGVSKTYALSGETGYKEALRRVDLTVAPGEFVCLLGPSGCGKTTLLNIISGLDTDFEGRVRFTPASADDTSREPVKPIIGYVFQEARLLPWMTVRDNVRLVIGERGQSADATRRVDDWLVRVGLRGYGDYYPGQLSIGMQQRVAVARALIVQPDVLVMDEPFSALDELTALRLRDELLDLWEETSCTVVFVTHNPLEAAYLADRVVAMTPSPGRIVGQLDIAAHLPRPRNAEDPAVWRLSRRAVRLLSGDAPVGGDGDATVDGGGDGDGDAPDKSPDERPEGTGRE